MGVGLALAVAELNRNRTPLHRLVQEALSLAALTMILGSAFLLTAHDRFPGAFALPVVLGTALMMAAPASFINRRLITLPPIVFVGKVSYSWYLWHWPMLALLHIVGGKTLPATASPLTVAMAFPVAVISWALIEQPLRQSTQAPVPLLLRYAGLSATMLAACGIIWASEGIPQRYPALAQMERARLTLAADPCLAADDVDTPNLPPACDGPPASGDAVALWGDSHAAALAPGVRSPAIAQGYSFLELTKTSCLPFTGVVRSIPRIPLQAARCQSFNDKALAMIRSIERVRVVILTGEWAGCLERTWEGGWLTREGVGGPLDPNALPSASAVQTLFVQALGLLPSAARASR